MCIEQKSSRAFKCVQHVVRVTSSGRSGLTTAAASHEEQPVVAHERVGVSGELKLATRNQPEQTGNRNYVIGTPLNGPTAPAAPPLPRTKLEELVSFLSDAGGQTLVITGAGCSTESSIPDYRSPGGAYSSGFKPMTHQEFLKCSRNRSRYWARSFAGWARFRSVTPNAAHDGIARLQKLGWVSHIITQNVDRLHHQAGSKRVLELHGTTHEVTCLKCGALFPREEFQETLSELNPEAAVAALDLVHAARNAAEAADEHARLLRAGTAAPLAENMREPGTNVLRPDGDVELPRQRPDGDAELGNAHQAEEFVVPPCPACGNGILKPNVVFFGDSLPVERAKMAMELAESATSVLVVGSSLAVWSAFRLVKAAKEKKGASLALINIGTTRADDVADVKVEARAGEAMSLLSTHPNLLLPPTPEV